MADAQQPQPDAPDQAAPAAGVGGVAPAEHVHGQHEERDVPMRDAAEGEKTEEAGGGDEGDADGDGGEEDADADVDADGSGRPSVVRTCIPNMGKWVSKAQVMALLDSAGVKYSTVAKDRSKLFAVVSFPSQEAKDAADAVINETRFKGRKLSAKVAVVHEGGTRRNKRGRDLISAEGPDAAPGGGDALAVPSKAPRMDAASKYPVAGENGAWQCQVCGCVTFADRDHCHLRACGAAKGTPGNITGVDNQGRWSCPTCNSQNPPYSVKCHIRKCGTHRLGIKVENNGAGSGRGGAENKSAEPSEPAAPLSIKDRVTPKWNVEYRAQLAVKEANIKRMVGSWVASIRKAYIKALADRQAPPQLKADAELFQIGTKVPAEGFLVTVENIIPSPELTGYRNKSSFTVGLDHSGAVTVGFREGAFLTTTNVESPQDCIHIPAATLQVVDRLTAFFRGSKYGPYDLGHHTGVWRRVTVRQSRNAACMMVVVMVSTKDLAAEAWDAELSALKECLVQPGLSVPVTSIGIQVYDGTSAPSEDHDVTIVHGEPTIREILLGKEFLISPNAFFQVHTTGAEKLFSKVVEWAGVAEKPTTVLDVCCGTGTISLCVAEHARQVVGIELVASAVADAQRNAARNGITNTVFIASKAEAVMADLLKKLVANKGVLPPSAVEELNVLVGQSETKHNNDDASDDDAEAAPSAAAPTAVPATADSQRVRYVAIVDPPRSGLQPAVIKALRRRPEVTRLVYVSCNPTKSFVDDAEKLCGPRGKSKRSAITGSPFRLVKVVPMDMFPHTDHIEMVALFER